MHLLCVGDHLACSLASSIFIIPAVYITKFPMVTRQSLSTLLKAEAKPKEGCKAQGAAYAALRLIIPSTLTLIIIVTVILTTHRPPDAWGVPRCDVETQRGARMSLAEAKAWVQQLGRPCLISPSLFMVLRGSCRAR
jgi:hypothetical protein